MSIQMINPILPPQPILPQNATTYSFPHHRLKSIQTDATQVPLVVILCGSFSPITREHIDLFEIVANYKKWTEEFEIMGGYISLVSDACGKPNLVPSRHRIQMCKLAIDHPTPSAWLMVDLWEAEQPKYTPTAQVLSHFNYQINVVLGGAQKPDGSRIPYHLVLLMGADTALTMLPPIWRAEDIEYIIYRFGLFIVSRRGTDLADILLERMKPYKGFVRIMHKMVERDMTFVKLGDLLKEGFLATNLLVWPVREYIEQHKLLVPAPRDAKKLCII